MSEAPPTEAQVLDAIRHAENLASRHYHAECLPTLADYVRELAAEDPNAELSDLLHSVADSSDLIIYTWKAQHIVLSATANGDAWEDAFGPNDTPTVEQRAYFALVADLFEELEPDTDFETAALALGITTEVDA